MYQLVSEASGENLHSPWIEVPSLPKATFLDSFGVISNEVLIRARMLRRDQEAEGHFKIAGRSFIVDTTNLSGFRVPHIWEKVSDAWRWERLPSESADLTEVIPGTFLIKASVPSEFADAAIPENQLALQ